MSDHETGCDCNLCFGERATAGGVDEWQLQGRFGFYGDVDGTWLEVGNREVGDPVPLDKLGSLRWRHTNGTTQPARTDDDGRLLGPVTDIFSETSDPEFDEMVDTSEALQQEWTGDPDGTIQSGLDADHHIRAQLVDGLPGEWEGSPWGSNDWRMRFGDGFQAVVILTPEFQSADAFIASAVEGAHFRELPHTRVDIGVKSGDDYIMRAALALAPKVDAVRRLVEELRDG